MKLPKKLNLRGLQLLPTVVIEPELNGLTRMKDPDMFFTKIAIMGIVVLFVFIGTSVARDVHNALIKKNNRHVNNKKTP